MDTDEYKLKKTISYLENIKGRHTELVTVYIPEGYNIQLKIDQLGSEAGTAANIQSKTVRNNVITAIERLISELRKVGKTPPHGLAGFSGNISEIEGKADFKVFLIEPPHPLKTNLYRCDNHFIMDAISDLVGSKATYGLIAMDLRDAILAKLKGQSIQIIKKMESPVMGKFRAGGQCLSADTLVQKFNGEIVPISEINEKDVLSSVDFEQNKLVLSQCLDRWTANKTIFKIKTKNPVTEIVSSPEHTFFVVNDKGIQELPAERLTEGDYLITPIKVNISGEVQFLKQPTIEKVELSEDGRNLLIKSRKNKNLPQWKLAKMINSNINQANISAFERGKLNFKKENLQKLCIALGINSEEFFAKHVTTVNIPKVLDIKLAQILGYFLGDGSAEKHRLCFFEQTREVAEYYRELIQNYFKANVALKLRKDKNYYEIKAYGRPLVDLININFGLPQGNQKRIPSLILKSINEILGAFLRGLFDAEGYVSGKIGLGMNNKTLSNQIKLSLLRFGIISSVAEYDNRRNPYTNNHRYTVEISDRDSLELFSKKIGFTSTKKCKKLKILLKNHSDTSYTRQVLTPGNRILDVVRQYGYNTRSFKTSSNFFRNERKMSHWAFKKAILSQITNKELLQKMESLLDSEITITKIKTIQKIDSKRDMVDLSVQNQNFIANGLVVHNSAGRFHRIRENQIKFFHKEVTAIAAHSLNGPEIVGILVGGPGPGKNELVDKYFTQELQKKVLAIHDIGHTDESGLRELINKSGAILENEEIVIEKKVVDVFLTHLAKDDSLSSYGKDEVKKNLKEGTVEVLLLSESLEESDIEEFSELAHKFNTEVHIISDSFQEGLQLKELGGFAAVLRYKR